MNYSKQSSSVGKSLVVKQQLSKIIGTAADGTSNNVLRHHEQKCIRVRKNNQKLFSINDSSNRGSLKEQQVHDRINKLTQLDFSGSASGVKKQKGSSKSSQGGALTTMALNESPYKRVPYEHKKSVRKPLNTSGCTSKGEVMARKAQKLEAHQRMCYGGEITRTYQLGPSPPGKSSEGQNLILNAANETFGELDSRKAVNITQLLENSGSASRPVGPSTDMKSNKSELASTLSRQPANN